VVQNYYVVGAFNDVFIRMSEAKINVAIFASGTGTNAQAIIDYFEPKPFVDIVRIYSNNASAKVLERALNHQIPTTLFDRAQFYHSDLVLKQLEADQTDLIVLAGFMWLIPSSLVDHFPDRIVNIHPALLPKYGGKGMFGHHVHEAVIANKEHESGITIHLVNERYDEGNILFQATCPVLSEDSADDLANRIHTLEHQHFPIQIEALAKSIKKGS
jgi:phosphoribosylglycinamide formyltransferase-1